MHWTSKAYHDCGSGAEMFRLRERKMELGLSVVVFGCGRSGWWFGLHVGAVGSLTA